MQIKQEKLQNKFIFFTTLALISVIGTSCGSRKVDQEQTPYEETKDEKEKKIDTLNSSLSRSQLRIEELDAKLSALTDKLDSLKITVDNLAGIKPIQTTIVGEASKPVTIIDDKKIEEMEAAKPHRPLSLEPAFGEFTQAIQLFKAGKFTESELAFNQFTEKHPEHILAGSAQFYAGESYYMLKEYKLALKEFEKVVSSFPTSPRAATALVRIAHCYDATGKKQEAEKTRALARDLYMGNPSLEWAAPNAASEEHSKVDIKTTPMEPKSSEPEHLDEKQTSHENG